MTALNFEGTSQERGWQEVTPARFNSQNGPTGALMVGSPEEVAEKILRHSESLGGITRFSFQMDSASLSHEKLKNSIQLIGEKVSKIVNG